MKSLVKTPLFLGLCFVLCACLNRWAVAQVAAETWNVETLGVESFASHSEYPNLRLPLRTVGAGGPLVKSWVKAPYGEELFVLTYVAGEVGTSERVQIIRAMVVHVGRSEVIADDVFAYLDPGNEISKVGTQPRWEWSPGVLLIHRPDAKHPRQVNLRASKFEESGAAKESK
jgi:hypothetical protein